MPYQFPYTNFHDLDLDWMLQQIKAMGAKLDEFKADLATSDTNNVGTFTTVFNRLQDYTNVLKAYMDFYNNSDPDHPIFIPSYTTIPYNEHEYSLMTGVTVNPEGFNLRQFTVNTVNDIVAEIQRQVVDNAVLFTPQNLTGSEKTIVIDNIGLSNNVRPYNMFDLSTGWMLSLNAVTTTYPDGWRRRVGYENFAAMISNGELIPNNGEFRTSSGGRAVACNYSMPYGEAGTPHEGTPIIYLTPGVYTVSCKVRIVDGNQPIPNYFRIGGAIWINSGENTITHAYKCTQNTHLTANPNDPPTSQHVTSDGIGYLHYTFTVEDDGRWVPVFYFQYDGATTSNIALSDIQLESGNTVTAYRAFAEEFVVTSNNVPDGLDTLVDEVNTLKQNVWHDRYEMPSVVSSFITSCTNTSKGDSLIFFTDPHPANDDTWNQRVYQDFGIISKAKRSYPCGMVVNGGDWLLQQQQDTQTQISKMAYVYGLGREMLGDSLVNIMGNHDANNHLGGSAAPTIPVGGFDAIFPGRTYYVLDKPNSVIKYAIWNTWTTGNALTTGWVTDQVAYFAQYLLEHKGEYFVFLSHMFVQSSDGIQHSVNDGATPPIYTPEVNIPENAADPTNIIIREGAKMAKAYNTGGTYAFNGVSYNYSSHTGRVLYILAGHVHKEMIMMYNTVPVFMAGSFGFNAATASSPRDNETYVNVINNIDGSTSSHLFHVINPLLYEVTSASGNTYDVGKTIQEADVILSWANGQASFTVL